MYIFEPIPIALGNKYFVINLTPWYDIFLKLFPASCEELLVYIKVKSGSASGELQRY